MDCNEVRALAPRFLHGGFTGREGGAVEAHINDCATCQQALANCLGEPLLRPHAPYFKAPPHLHERVAGAIAGAAANADASPRKRMPDWAMPAWLKMGAVSFATALLTLALVLPMRFIAGDDAIADALIASHVRWSRLDKLTDVPTSDRHTVKPWLSRKLGYSPLVPELRDAGFALQGGRIDYVNDRFVAAIVYKRRDHVIDVYVWPGAQGGSHAKAASHRGYHAVKWTMGDMTYWAVSDLNADELKQFADLYAQAT